MDEQAHRQKLRAEAMMAVELMLLKVKKAMAAGAWKPSAIGLKESNKAEDVAGIGQSGRPKARKEMKDEN